MNPEFEKLSRELDDWFDENFRLAMLALAPFIGWVLVWRATNSNFLGFVTWCIVALVAYNYMARLIQKSRNDKHTLERIFQSRLADYQESYVWKQLLSAEQRETLSKCSSLDELYEVSTRYEQNIDGLIIGSEHPKSLHRFRRDDNKPPLRVPVILPDRLRTRHLYVVGKTGSGKTTILQNLIRQDIKSGAGFAVIAPEAEMLVEQIIPMIPRNRANDLIYISPTPTGKVVGFNPLKIANGEDFDRRVDETLSIIARSIGSTTARMERIIANTVKALIERDDTTLRDIERLLDPADTSYRNTICRTTKIPAVRKFFSDIYPTFPKDSHLPITNRIDRLINAKVTSRFLCNEKKGTSLNFRKAMDSGKIMLFNLSDGLLGEGNAQVIGELVISKLQSVATARADIPARQRRRFYIYIDEFQTFTGVADRAYEILLSRARKYEVGLVLAHQQTGQIPSKLMDEILGNVGSIICMEVGDKDAKRFSREFVVPIIVGDYGEYKTGHPDPIDLQLQKPGKAHSRIGQHSMRVDTPLAPKVNLARADKLIAYSLNRFGSIPPDEPDLSTYRNDYAEDDEDFIDSDYED